MVAVKKRKRPPQNVRPGERPEEALFRNVITQAIDDATMRLPAVCETAFKRNMARIRDQAREWVRRQGEDFHMVCELAGLEASRVHQFAMAKIKESIEQENAKTAEFLTSAMPGVVANFSQAGRDRHGPDARDGEKIEFSSQNENSTQNQPFNAASSGDIAAAEKKL